jgi:hypothetical protein
MRVEYFWLCTSCCSVFTLIFDERRGVGLAPFGGTRDHKTRFTVILDINKLRCPDQDADATGAGNEAESRSIFKAGMPVPEESDEDNLEDEKDLQAQSRQMTHSLEEGDI